MYILNMLCELSWNKKKKLTARMHGVEGDTCMYLTCYMHYLE
jgi:hypothetical protein